MLHPQQMLTHVGTPTTTTATSHARPTRATLMGMHRKLTLLCVAASLSPAAVPDIVKVDAGRVKGTVANGVAAFKGIPFAAPPVGALRWKAPQAVPHWEGVREA